MRRALEIGSGFAIAVLAVELGARALATAPLALAAPPAVTAPSAPPPSSSAATVAPSAAPPAPSDRPAPEEHPSPTEPPADAGEPLDATDPAGARAVVAGPGAAYDDDASLPKHADPVASYSLVARLDAAAHRVHGEGTITWRNASRVPQRELWVHLYLNAFRDERSLFLRTPRSGFRGDAPRAHGRIDVTHFAVRGMGDVWPKKPASPDDPDDATDVRVALPEAVPPGATITIDVAFDDQLPSVALRTGYAGSFHMVAQWFPKLARLEPDGRWAHFEFHPYSEFYADYGRYDVTTDVPEGFVVGATGALEHEAHHGGRVVQRWAQDDVHDFAFAAWDHFEVATATACGVSIRCLYPPGYRRAAEVELDSARFGLAHFGARYGAYPYGTLTIVHPPDDAAEAGGMEYPTLITTGGPWYAPWTSARVLENVTIHELGHQWFYGLVGTNEHAWPFLDEGINSYAEIDAMEARWPDASVASAAGLRLGLPAFYRISAAAVEHHGPVARAASAFPTGGDYGALVYSRTATILETLARVYGREGLERAIGRYARRYRFDHPGPAELVASVREVLGRDAADALVGALFDGGWVDYAVESIASEPLAPGASDGARYRGSALVRRMGTLSFPVDVDLVGADGHVERVRWDGRDATTRLAWRGASPLVSAVVDPEHRVLLDDRLDDQARRTGAPLLAPRVLDQTAFLAAAGLLGVVP